MPIDLVVYIMIAINAIISYKAFNDSYFFRKYEFHIGSIRAGEQYRMFTSAFIHVDIQHLLFNMLTLFIFGRVVVEKMGIIGFLLVYVFSLICGSLLTLFFHKDDYYYRAVGASGAVVGIIFSAILLKPGLEINFLPGFVFGIAYLLFSIYGMKAKSDNIGHTAHFGGAIGGYAITLCRVPDLFYTETQTVILLAIPIVILFVMQRMGKL